LYCFGLDYAVAVTHGQQYFYILVFTNFIYASFIAIDVSAPVIIQHPVSGSVELHTNNINHTLQCEAIGYQITYSWIKNGKIVVPNNHYNVVDGNLSIFNVKLPDRGQYQCKVSNIGGSVVSSHAEIMIEGIVYMYMTVYSTLRM